MTLLILCTLILTAVELKEAEDCEFRSQELIGCARARVCVHARACVRACVSVGMDERKRHEEDVVHIKNYVYIFLIETV